MRESGAPGATSTARLTRGDSVRMISGRVPFVLDVEWGKDAWFSLVVLGSLLRGVPGERAGADGERATSSSDT